jgi:hypothetical protein
MADLNIVEKANKIISFRKVIRDICRKKGLEYPDDAKIAEYIADCGGDECVYDINDFMSDYENKQGVFTDPFGDFKTKVLKELGDVADHPSDAKMHEYIREKGYDVKGFLSTFRRERIMSRMSPLEKNVLDSVLEKCSIPQLVSLWNIWVEEAAVVGEDSYIYNLTNHKDAEFLNVHMELKEISKVNALIRNGVRYMSWHNLNDNAIIGFSDEQIIDIIVGDWTNIFPRFLVWGECYQNLGVKGHSSYFEGFFDIVVRKHLLAAIGYDYNPQTGAVKEKFERYKVER